MGRQIGRPQAAGSRQIPVIPEAAIVDRHRTGISGKADLVRKFTQHSGDLANHRKGVRADPVVSRRVHDPLRQADHDSARFQERIDALLLEFLLRLGE